MLLGWASFWAVAVAVDVVGVVVVETAQTVAVVAFGRGVELWGKMRTKTSSPTLLL
jgi:hypothetical protein